MEKLLMVILSVLFLIGLSFTQIMNIHTGTGTDVYNLADIDSITFTVSGDTGIFIDIDGNVYHTVRIGTQVWLRENLKVTHYRNGDPIPNVTDGAQWTALTSGAYCNYNNDPSLADIYGRLYNWFPVVDPRGLAPAGWHVPSDAEWETLVNFLGGEAVAGVALKEAGTAHWISPNTGATNSSGFTALPGGYRDGSGYFYGMGYDAYFWSSTEYSIYRAWTRALHYNSAQVHRGSNYEQSGFSVRCVRD